MPFSSSPLCIYNGFEFPDGRTETIGIESRPNWDAAGRTISYWTHSIKLRTILVADQGETTDDLMAEVRELLLVPGKELIFNGVGYGDLDINTGGTEKDVVWGPKPQLLSYTPIGTGSCELVFQLDVAIPECADPVYQRAIMEFNFQMTYELDYAGWCTRRMSGYYAIPQTRGTGRQLDETTDDYWNKITPAIPENFRRDRRVRTLSENKCRANFEIIDEEMGRNIFPDGVVMATASHQMENTEKGFLNWVGVISAEYEVAADKPIDIAWAAFWNLAGRRINMMMAAKGNAAPRPENQPGPIRQVGGLVGGGLGGAGGVAAGFGLAALAAPFTGGSSLIAAGIIGTAASSGAMLGTTAGRIAGGAVDRANGHPFVGHANPLEASVGTFVPLRLRIKEPEIYGRPKASFELTYQIGMRLSQILQFGGLWRPTGNSWQQWVTSMDKVYGPFGMAGLKFRPNDDVIIDLCLERNRGARFQHEFLGPPGPGARMEGVNRNDQDPGGWIEYRNQIEVKTEDNVIEHKELPKDESPPLDFKKPKGNGISREPELLDELYPGDDQKRSRQPQSKLQRRTIPAIEVFLTGYALRMGAEIPVPRLVSIGGYPAYQANRKDMGEGFKSLVVGNYLVPMIFGTWRNRYIITPTPKKTNVPLEMQ